MEIHGRNTKQSATGGPDFYIYLSEFYTNKNLSSLMKLERKGRMRNHSTVLTAVN